MIVTRTALDALRVGFKTEFQAGIGLAQPMWQRVATRVTSTHASETYGWIGEIPELREWLGPRHVHALSEHDYMIKNRQFERTIGVQKIAIEDDALGIFAQQFRVMGKAVAQHYDKLVWPMLPGGWTALCYDRQYFFDADHPVLDEAGNPQSVANTDGGAGAPWFLIDTNQVMLPIILQVRKDWEFVQKDRPEDDNVFRDQQFLYGVDGRCAAGYGFWQGAWGSKQTLNADSYAAARAAMIGMKGDYGVQLGLTPNLLIVPPSLESAGRTLLQSQLVNGGESNPWAGTAELLVVPWIA